MEKFHARVGMNRMDEVDNDFTNLESCTAIIIQYTGMGTQAHTE